MQKIVKRRDIEVHLLDMNRTFSLMKYRSFVTKVTGH